ncbi:hypothetical protein NL676_028494 [Syzygium grande]|nr:hypothetical protein NL676_028494 [Syzygium grande]
MLATIISDLSLTAVNYMPKQICTTEFHLNTLPCRGLQSTVTHLPTTTKSPLPAASTSGWHRCDRPTLAGYHHHQSQEKSDPAVAKTGINHKRTLELVRVTNLGLKVELYFYDVAAEHTIFNVGERERGKQSR